MLISAFYVLGSLLFVAASVLFHPFFADLSAHLYVLAVGGFMAGSSCFILGGGLTLRGALHARDRSTLAAAFSLLGAVFLFCGSTAFLPLFMPSGATIGTYTFRAGSIAYIVSSVIGLTSRHTLRERSTVVALVTYLVGACCFVAGGMCFLRALPAPGSLFWVCGSTLFLWGSAIYFRQYAGRPVGRSLQRYNPQVSPLEAP
jgi:hypothetical protein